MELSSIAIAAIVVIAIYVVLKILSIPFKLLKALIVNTIVGSIILFLVNIVGGYFGLHIDINIITALVTGIFGIPGVILLIIIKFLV